MRLVYSDIIIVQCWAGRYMGQMGLVHVGHILHVVLVGQVVACKRALIGQYKCVQLSVTLTMKGFVAYTIERRRNVLSSGSGGRLTEWDGKRRTLSRIEQSAAGASGTTGAVAVHLVP